MFEIYTLPELTFVGGETQELIFDLKDENNRVYNADECSANFAVCSCPVRSGTPLFSCTPVIKADENNIFSILSVIIPSDKTVELYGKYIYQITIKSSTGSVEIPMHGIINIVRNIDTSFCS